MKRFVLYLISLVGISSASAVPLETDYSLKWGNYYGYTDYAKPYNKLHKQNNLNSSLNLYGRVSYLLNDDYKTSLIGYFMADSAKKVENYNQGIWGEEVYSLTETPFGDFSFGQDDNVAAKFAVGAPCAGAYRANSNLVNFIVNPNWYSKGSQMAYKTLDSTYINTDGSSFKLNYMTPELSGIKLGATFIPETYSRSGLVAKNAKYKDNSAYVLGAYGLWDVLGYELEVSLGFADYHKNDTEYSAGVSIYRKGWTLGASYRKTEVSKSDYAIDKTNLYDAYREGYAYNFGISYEIGPYMAGVSYFASKSDKFANKDEIFSFFNNFQYNKYLTFSLTAAHLQATGSNNDVTNNSKGYAFILGAELKL